MHLKAYQLYFFILSSFSEAEIPLLAHHLTEHNFEIFYLFIEIFFFSLRFVEPQSILLLIAIKDASPAAAGITATVEASKDDDSDHDDNG